MIRTLMPDQKAELIERLAELEHEQWVMWSVVISGKEKISEERYLRWKRLWVPYKELTEEEKDKDRVGARKVLQLFEEMRMEVLSK